MAKGKKDRRKLKIRDKRGRTKIPSAKIPVAADFSYVNSPDRPPLGSPDVRYAE